MNRWESQGFGECGGACKGLMKDMACLKKIYETGCFDGDMGVLHVSKKMRNQLVIEMGKGAGHLPGEVVAEGWIWGQEVGRLVTTLREAVVNSKDHVKMLLMAGDKYQKQGVHRKR